MNTIGQLLLIFMLFALAFSVEWERQPTQNFQNKMRFLRKRGAGSGCGYGGGYGGKPHDYGPNAEARHQSPSYHGCSGADYSNAPFGLGRKPENQ
uniref:Glycine-rich protein n=1 Tax=Steinernema glaseri TaxID=37863 RepID=A0A1I7ZZJ8_9BILA